MDPSPLSYALERIGDRWTLLIVDALIEGPRRFGEIEQAVAGIAPTVLTKRLRQLETDGIIVGRPYSVRPIRLSYELTGAGASLATAIHVLRDWGAGHTGDRTPVLHAACGTPLTTRLWCSCCESPVDHPEADANIDL